MKKLIWWLIVLFSLLIRVVGLEKSPATIGFDEAALGYNAYSLLKTGKDEYGYSWPLSLRSFNDYKPALYSYLSMPFIAVMGLTQASTRMVSALAGTISVIIMYFLIKRWVKDEVWVMLLWVAVSVQPWRLHFSRIAFESNVASMFFLAGVYFLMQKKRWLSLMMLTISAYTYHSARLAAPLLLLLWAMDPIKALFEKKVFLAGIRQISKNKKRFIWLVLFLFLSWPIFASGGGKLVLTRFNQTNIFSRYYPYTPRALLVDINKPWLNWQAWPGYYFLSMVLGRVMGYVSSINLSVRQFHWVKGSPQVVAEMGMFSWWVSLLALVGLVVVLARFKKDEKCRIIFYWLLAGIGPAAVTWNWFHPLRALTMFPAIELLFVIGAGYLLTVLSKGQKKLVLLGSIGLVMVSGIFFVNNELVYGAWLSNGEFQPGGFKDGVPRLAQLQENYETVIINSPHAQSYIFFLFYQSFPPEIVQSYADSRPKPGVGGNLNFDFYKYKFSSVYWPEDKEMKKTLFWISSEIKEEEVLSDPNKEIEWMTSPLGYNAVGIIKDKDR